MVDWVNKLKTHLQFACAFVKKKKKGIRRFGDIDCNNVLNIWITSKTSMNSDNYRQIIYYILLPCYNNFIGCQLISRPNSGIKFVEGLAFPIYSSGKAVLSLLDRKTIKNIHPSTE